MQKIRIKLAILGGIGLLIPSFALGVNDVSILQTANFQLNTIDAAPIFTTITAQAGDQATNFDVQSNYIDVTLDNLSTVTFKTTVAGQNLQISKQAGSDDYTSAPATITDQVTLTGTGATVIIRVRVITVTTTTTPAPTIIAGGAPGGPAGEGVAVPGCNPVTNAAVRVNNGAAYTNLRNVTLNLSAGNAAGVVASEDPAFAGLSFNSFASSLPFALSAGEGLKTIYVRFRNDCSMVTTSATITYSLSAQAGSPQALLPRALTSGSAGTDVTTLQKILASDPTVYPRGLVTGYFGVLTLEALKQFQLKYNIAKAGDPNFGIVDEATRQKLFEIYNELNKPKPLILTRDLRIGARGTDVTALQKFLAADKTIYPRGLVTGYFGTLTRDAVQRFQLKYGLADTDDPQFGIVNALTRLKIRELTTVK